MKFIYITKLQTNEIAKKIDINRFWADIALKLKPPKTISFFGKSRFNEKYLYFISIIISSL